MTDPRITMIVTDVLGRLPLGRASTWRPIAERMMELILESPEGDHLEIGVLHGATVIMAAMTLDAFGCDGDVYCIDPLSGFYPASPLKPRGVYSATGELITKGVEPTTGVPVTRDVFVSNVSFFGVGHRIRLVQAFSHPWPDELKDATFASAFIDGDHYDDGPMNDWSNVHPRIVSGGLVWFDDCNENCPGVQRACTVAEKTPGWTFAEHYMDQTFVVKKLA